MKDPVVSHHYRRCWPNRLCTSIPSGIGAMLGNDQPVILQLLEITPALGAGKAWSWSWMIARFRCCKK